MDPFSFLISLIVSLAISAISIIMAPKPKREKPGPAKELTAPTAEAGKPIPEIYGTLKVESPNVLWYGEKSINEYTV
jgi:hypothetical protein